LRSMRYPVGCPRKVRVPEQQARLPHLALPEMLRLFRFSASSRHRHGVSEGYPDRGPVTVSVVAGHIRSGLEKRHVKISTDRGRCGRVAGRNFARDGKNPRASARTAILPHPGINETTSRPTVADPYYRLSDPYYGYSDQLQGLFDFYAVPPFSPGYTYGHVRPGGWR